MLYVRGNEGDEATSDHVPTKIGKPQGIENMLHPTNHEPSSQPSRAVRITLRCLAIIALLLSGYLAVVSFQSLGPAGCGGSEVVDCDQVLASRWSKWVHIPVAIPAILLYTTLFIASFGFNASWSKMARIATVTCGLLAAISALWFIGLQVFVIQKLCTYCLAVHSCGLAVGVLAFVALRDTGSSVIKTAMLGAGTGFVCLTLGQVLFVPSGIEVRDFVANEPASSDSSAQHLNDALASTASSESKQKSNTDSTDSESIPELRSQTSLKPATSNSPFSPSFGGDDALGLAASGGRSSERLPTADSSSDDTAVQAANSKQRMLKMFDGKLVLNIYQHPILGDPEAEHILLVLFDYACPDCRRLSKQIKRFQISNPQVAFVALPIPMNATCNRYVKKTGKHQDQSCEYARMAISAWKTDPTKFAQFHDYLMEHKDPPSATAARLFAQNLFGEQQFNSELSKPRINSLVTNYTSVYGLCKAGQIPKMIFKGRVIVGAPNQYAKFDSAVSKLLTP